MSHNYFFVEAPNSETLIARALQIGNTLTVTGVVTWVMGIYLNVVIANIHTAESASMLSSD